MANGEALEIDAVVPANTFTDVTLLARGDVIVVGSNPDLCISPLRAHRQTH
jgi:hypothetical protein